MQKPYSSTRKLARRPDVKQCLALVYLNADNCNESQYRRATHLRELHCTCTTSSEPKTIHALPQDRFGTKRCYVLAALAKLTPERSARSGCSCDSSLHVPASYFSGNFPIVAQQLAKEEPQEDAKQQEHVGDNDRQNVPAVPSLVRDGMRNETHFSGSQCCCSCKFSQLRTY